MLFKLQSLKIVGAGLVSARIMPYRLNTGRHKACPYKYKCGSRNCNLRNISYITRKNILKIKADSRVNLCHLQSLTLESALPPPPTLLNPRPQPIRLTAPVPPYCHKNLRNI